METSEIAALPENGDPIQARDDRGEMEEPDLTVLLPEDMLADVLSRLAPRDLAACRCVRRRWRYVVDDRRLLRADLLPLKVAGIFIDYHGNRVWDFFSRPSTGPAVSAWFDFLPDGTNNELNFCRAPRLHHSNGLLLSRCDHVFNPATRLWASLPPLLPPSPAMAPGHFSREPYLMFDPSVSPHYEVFLVPRILYKANPMGPMHSRLCAMWGPHVPDPAVEEGEWPPSPCIMQVFSSSTGNWEHRSYLREGEPAGSVADMRVGCRPFSNKLGAVTWRGELFVQCEAHFVMRISLSNNTFQVIKPPIICGKMSSRGGFYLGRSKGGVHFALVDNFDHPCRLWVWVLQESCGKMEWMLKHQADLEPMLPYHQYGRPVDGPWMLQDFNCDKWQNGKKEAAVQDEFEWDSDDDNVLHNHHGVYNGRMNIAFLGFHSYKDVVFFTESGRRGLAYHLNSSKIQQLGDIYPEERYTYQPYHISGCFPYTPCRMEEIPLGN